MHAALFGLIVADVIGEPVDLRRPPTPGGLQLIRSITLTTGGNVCNAGVAMAKLGMNVAAAGLVGQDVLGAAMIDRLRQAGVDTSAVFTTRRPRPARRWWRSSRAANDFSFTRLAPRRCWMPTPFASVSRCFRGVTWVQIGYFGLLPALTPDLPGLLRELRAAAPRTHDRAGHGQSAGGASCLNPSCRTWIFCAQRTEAAAHSPAKRTRRKSPRSASR